MIHQGYFHQQAELFQISGHLEVLIRWVGILTRVVMNQDKGAGILQDKIAEDIPGVHGARVHGSPEEHLYSQKIHFRVQGHNPDLFCLSCKVRTHKRVNVQAGTDFGHEIFICKT